jgi:hypothetical protein
VTCASGQAMLGEHRYVERGQFSGIPDLSTFMPFLYACLISCFSFFHFLAIFDFFCHFPKPR